MTFTSCQGAVFPFLQVQ